MVWQACGVPVSPARLSLVGIPRIGTHHHAICSGDFLSRVSGACSGGVSQRGHGVLVGSMGSAPSAPATSGGRGSDLREGPQLPARTQSGSPSAATQGAIARLSASPAILAAEGKEDSLRLLNGDLFTLLPGFGTSRRDKVDLTKASNYRFSNRIIMRWHVA